MDGLMIRPVTRHEEHPACLAVMRELRPHLADLQDFSARLARQQANSYCLLAAWDGADLAGLAGYRITENLLYGRFLYVDDLITRQQWRSKGVGAALIASLRDEANVQACTHLVLDTGLDNAFAQRFYFRQGLLSRGMHFVMPL